MDTDGARMTEDVEDTYTRGTNIDLGMDTAASGLEAGTDTVATKPAAGTDAVATRPAAGTDAVATKPAADTDGGMSGQSIDDKGATGGSRGIYTGGEMNPEARREDNGEPGISLWQKCSVSQKIYFGLVFATVLLNLLSWCSTAFCDFYVAYIFPIWVNTYGRLSGIFPFSVGEWLLGAGVLVLLIAFMCGLADLVLFLLRRECPALIRRALYFFAWVFLAVCLIMTLNCFMLYHVSPFAERYLAIEDVNQEMQGNSGQQLSGTAAEGYSMEEFLSLRNKVAQCCNELSGKMLRDKKGYIIYFGSVSRTGESLDMQDKAREAMQELGEQYPQLAGYYPRPKPLLSSDFLCQQNMLGWYFPFSMEANYNDVAYVMNLPATMCHELAHLKGLIYEDEANFIGYLACVQSTDIYFEYSGYLSVLAYLEQDLQKARKQEPTSYQAAVEAQGLVELEDVVYQDDIFVTDEEWERIEGKAFLDTETVSKATDAFVDTTLKVNGVEDGMVSYSRVVELMLLYERAAG